MRWDILLSLYRWKFTAKSVGERILKISQHLTRLEATIWQWHLFFRTRCIGLYFISTLFVYTAFSVNMKVMTDEVTWICWTPSQSNEVETVRASWAVWQMDLWPDSLNGMSSGRDQAMTAWGLCTDSASWTALPTRCVMRPWLTEIRTESRRHCR